MTDRGFVSTLAWNCAGTTNATRRKGLLSQHGPALRVSAVHPALRVSAGLSLSDQVRREVIAQNSTFACVAGRERIGIRLISLWDLGTSRLVLSNRITYLYLEMFPHSQKVLAHYKKTKLMMKCDDLILLMQKDFLNLWKP